MAALDSHHAALLPGSTIMATRPGRAWYSSSIEEFLVASGTMVFGQLTQHSEFDDNLDQKAAWTSEIKLLQQALIDLSGQIFFEYTIPRMGRRIDVALLFPNVLVVLEFKLGTAKFDRSAIDQVWDYALDLKNFHGGSHSAKIVPVLIPLDATKSISVELICDSDGVYEPLLVSPSGLRDVLAALIIAVEGERLDAEKWYLSSYRPTPTIIEAARSLYPLELLSGRRGDRISGPGP